MSSVNHDQIVLKHLILDQHGITYILLGDETLFKIE